MPVQSMITEPSPHEMVAAAKSGCKSCRVQPSLKHLEIRAERQTLLLVGHAITDAIRI